MRKVRVVILTGGDRLSDLVARKLYLPESNTEVVGVVKTSMPLKQKLGILKGAIKADSLYYAIYIQIESILASFVLPSKKRLTSIMAKAQRDGTPLHQTQTPNDKSTIDFIKSLSPDLVLSVRPGHILRRTLIENVPPIYNVHVTKLPFFRGIAGVMQALLAENTELGMTVHLIEDERVDRGRIAAQGVVKAVASGSVFANTLQLYAESATLLYEAVNAFFEDRTLTENEGGSYHSWPGKHGKEQLRKHGLSLVNLNDLKLTIDV